MSRTGNLGLIPNQGNRPDSAAAVVIQFCDSKCEDTNRLLGQLLNSGSKFVIFSSTVKITQL
jgi:hypothetical protein